MFSSGSGNDNLKVRSGKPLISLKSFDWSSSGKELRVKPVYKVDRILEEKGVKVLRLPTKMCEFNPIGKLFHFIREVGDLFIISSFEIRSFKTTENSRNKSCPDTMSYDFQQRTWPGEALIANPPFVIENKGWRDGLCRTLCVNQTFTKIVLFITCWLLRSQLSIT